MTIETPEAPPRAAELGSDEPAPLSPHKAFLYSIANLGYGAFYSFNNFVLPLFLNGLTKDAVILGLMGSTHSVEGSVIQPIVGSVSDRLPSRLGRRRPFMLIFTPISAFFMLLTPAAAALPASVRLAAAILCIFLFTVTFNIAFDPYQALLPDITPEPQRGRVTGLWQLMGNFGQAAILLTPLLAGERYRHWVDARAMFTLVGILMTGTMVVTCLAIRERPGRQRETEPSGRHRRELVETLRGLLTLRQAAKGITVFFLTGAGIGAVLPFLTVFVKTITHCSDSTALSMPLILMATTALGVMPFGWLTDRLGPRAVLMIGLALIALASINGLWVQTLQQVSVVMAVAGLGNAAQAASSYPLLTDLVPGEEVGFYTGLQATALSIAQPATVFITGKLINQGGYRVVFMVCAICIVAGMAVLTTVRTNRAGAEIAARRRSRG